VGSVRLADALLKIDTPNGPCWHRYLDDGYGEHDDGSAYDGVGRGRAWPLLTGERAHYEIACGNDPLPLMEAMARMASPGGMLPEQVWDASAIPERGLYPGQATGSAMPLAWTHAEYLKLVASRALKRPFDRPESVWRRYGGKRCTPSRATWCEHAVITAVPPGISVVLALRESAVVRYGFDGWRNIVEAPTSPNSLGVHVLTIDTSQLAAGQRLDFTFRYVPGDRWVGEDYRVSVEPAAEGAGPQ